MTELDIEMDLQKQLIAYKKKYPVDIIYPNTEYTASTGVDYIQPFLLPGKPLTNTIGENASQRFKGVYQLTIKTDADTGKVKVKKYVDQLKEFFCKNTVIKYFTPGTRITNFYLGSFAQDNDSFRQVVNIQYLTDLY